VAVEIVGILDRERREVGQRLAEKEGQLLDAKARLRDLGLRSGSEILHPLVQKVVQISEMLVQSQQKRVKLEASRSAITAAMAQQADLRQYLIDLEPVVGQELVALALGLDRGHQQVVLEVEQQLTADRVRLQKLAEYLGPRNPEYIELQQSIDQSQAYLDDLRQRAARRSSQLSSQQLGPLLTSMIDEQLRQARLQETRLQEEYQRAESEAVRLNGRVAYVSILEHDLKLLRDLHDTLRNRIANIDIQQNQSDVRVAIVSPPSAGRRPVTPRAVAVALFCLVLGSGGGLVTVWVQEALDDRFRSPEELRQQLGVPLLAIVRSLSLAATEGLESLQVHVDPEAVESEAFRTLRTALAFSDSPVHVVAFSSAEPEDGKTTVLSNLGAALAQSGKRTLLIDGDLRRPGLTKRFQLRGRPGVGDILREEPPLEAGLPAAICPSGLAKMDVLPCGRRPPDPAGLMASQRFGELLAWCIDHYDIVLIDTPPILAASDAAVVGRQTDGMVVVVQPEKNHRHLVHRAVDELRLAGLPLLGVVANRIAAAGGHYDQGGYGYGYGYGYRYTSNDRYDEVALDRTDAPSEIDFESDRPERWMAAAPIPADPVTARAPVSGPPPVQQSHASRPVADGDPIRPRRAA
jgi:capsular exopolysaccharide synthesis family protein